MGVETSYDTIEHIRTGYSFVKLSIERAIDGD